ncbi:snare-like protein [Morchella conica CCBAS932]|uniref:Coatomer subunit zeta n=1 Tax=Morchella conica CCBAS932 TaxID=1392247 RepID=A0A3N4KKY5_9PEZI|nr:snare-like protein [Morchella conica CCBAS932]
MSPNLTLFSVNAVLLLANTGTRLLAKYYHPPHSPASSAPPYPTPASQAAFEKGLTEKTATAGNDIILYDGRVVVFKTEGDVVLYVVGGADENELLLWNALLALRDTLSILLRNTVDKRTILEHFDVVSLAVDEVVDDGVILETDPATIAARVTKQPMEDAPSVKNIDLSEQGLLNAWEFGKRQLADRLRQGL